MVAIQCPVLGCDIRTTNLIRIRLHSAIGFDKNFNLIPNTSFFQNRMVKDWFSKLCLGKGCKSWETGSVNTSRFLRTSHNYVSKSFFYFCHQKTSTRIEVIPISSAITFFQFPDFYSSPFVSSLLQVLLLILSDFIWIN